MAKQRSQLLVSAHAKKMRKAAAPSVNLLGEDDWVVVRKQKITILIPSLPGTEQSNAPITAESQPEMPRIAVETEAPCSATISPMNPSPEREERLPQAPECAIPVVKIVHPPSGFSYHKSSSPGHLMTSENARVTASDHEFSILTERKRALLFHGEMPLLNRRMRAINIEKKIRKAGGLNCWLVSLGLDRFVKIFQQKKVNRFQLAALTMKKLKDMGAFAVGPRRKLMHALDCLCQPYCFEHV